MTKTDTPAPNLHRPEIPVPFYAEKDLADFEWNVIDNRSGKIVATRPSRKAALAVAERLCDQAEQALGGEDPAERELEEARLAGPAAIARDLGEAAVETLDFDMLAFDLGFGFGGLEDLDRRIAAAASWPSLRDMARREAGSAPYRPTIRQDLDQEQGLVGDAFDLIMRRLGDPRRAYRVGHRIHTHHDGAAAYDACQCRETHQNGDLLVIRNGADCDDPARGRIYAGERLEVVGIAWAWPIAVSAEAGALHQADPGFDFESVAPRTAWQAAADLATAHGLALCPAVAAWLAEA